MHFTRPGESINSYIKSKPFPNLPEYRTAYFLFDRFRIATTSNANVSRIMNSSYVLIKYHTFLQTRERVGARPSASRVSILLSMCRSSCRTFALGGFRLVVRIAPAQTSFYEVSLKNERKSRRYSVTVPNCGHGCPQSGRACAADRAGESSPRGIRLLGRILFVFLLILW